MRSRLTDCFRDDAIFSIIADYLISVTRKARCTARAIRRYRQSSIFCMQEICSGMPSIPYWNRVDDVFERHVRQAYRLHTHVRKLLKRSWQVDGLCDVVACERVTGKFLPFANGGGSPTERNSDAYGARMISANVAGSIPIEANASVCGNIVVCSPACYHRAKQLKKSSPTLFGEFGPILRRCVARSSGSEWLLRLSAPG